MMTRFQIATILICVMTSDQIGMSLQAQSRADSIRLALHGKQDPNKRIDLLNMLSWEIRTTSPDSAISISQRSVTESRGANYRRGLGSAYHTIGCTYQLLGNDDSAIYYLEKACRIREEIHDSLGWVASLGTLAPAYVGKMDLLHALNSFQLAERIAKNLRSEVKLAMIYNNWGKFYLELGSFTEAQAYFLKGLEHAQNELTIARTTGNKDRINLARSSIAYKYINLGEVYSEMGDDINGLKYCRLAIGLFHDLGDSIRLSDGYNNIAGIFRAERKFDSALYYYNKTLVMESNMLDMIPDPGIYSNIANVYSDRGESCAATDPIAADTLFRKALVYYREDVKLSREQNDLRSLADALINLASLLKLLNQNAEGEKALLEAIDICNANRMKDVRMHAEQELSKVYEKMNLWEKSLQHYKMYISIRDSIFNEENTRNNVRSEMQYEFGRKQAADSIRNAEQQKQENLKHENEIKQQRLYTYGGIAGFMLMLIVAVVSFRAYRNKQKANFIIAQQKHMVEEKQKEIIDSINYAKRIQNALLPSEHFIRNTLDKLRKQ